MDHAEIMSADDSFIVKVKMSVETGSIHMYAVSVDISDCRSLLESPWYTFYEFVMAECRRFAVGIFMTYVIVSEILLLPG